MGAFSGNKSYKTGFVRPLAMGHKFSLFFCSTYLSVLIMACSLFSTSIYSYIIATYKAVQSTSTAHAMHFIYCVPQL